MILFSIKWELLQSLKNSLYWFVSAKGKMCFLVFVWERSVGGCDEPSETYLRSGYRTLWAQRDPEKYFKNTI